MAIAINSKELLTLLEVTPSWQNIMLTGRHGIGKSQILTKYFESKGMRVVALFYGDKIDALYHGMQGTKASKSNIRYLDTLPKEFTKEDLVALRLANGDSPVVKTVICRWVKEGKVEKIGTNLWQKNC